MKKSIRMILQSGARLHLLCLLLANVLWFSTFPGFAKTPDLIDIFERAVVYDPEFQAAMTQRMSLEEALPQASAGYLPQVTAFGELGRNWLEATTTDPDPAPTVQFFGSLDYSVVASQPLFNYSAWKAIASAKQVVKQAEATFNAAAQDLMLRVATGYFVVLDAKDNLRFTIAEKEANERQLEQARERYNVGLEAITAVYEAQARYDATVASEIAARNNVANALEDLRKLTGEKYDDVMSLDREVPLVRPVPDDADAWVGVSTAQNYSLLAATFAAESAQKNIEVQRGGNFPTADVFARYNQGIGRRVGNFPFNTQGATIGLNFDFPIIQGGLTASLTRQAYYDYETALSQQEAVYLNTVASTYQAYNDIISGISKVTADKQAIVSAQNQVDSTDAQFRVGTRTMVDVLDALRDLYEQQRIFATDQYTYLLATLQLKALASTLSVEDLRQINALFNPDHRYTVTSVDDDDVFYDRDEDDDDDIIVEGIFIDGDAYL